MRDHGFALRINLIPPVVPLGGGYINFKPVTGNHPVVRSTVDIDEIVQPAHIVFPLISNHIAFQLLLSLGFGETGRGFQFFVRSHKISVMD